MVFGVYGATRTSELTQLQCKDVTEQGTVFVVKLRETKTNVVRTFTVEDEYASCVRKYRNLRSPNTPHTRFFVNYQKGKCTQQPIGKNKFSSTPKLIAMYLELEDAAEYTGHSFRRTSATILADAGADLLLLKRHGGWKSSSVAEGYVENSINNKRKIVGLISTAIASHTATTKTVSSSSNVLYPAESYAAASHTMTSNTDTSYPIECDEFVSAKIASSTIESIPMGLSSIENIQMGILTQSNNLNITTTNKDAIEKSFKSIKIENCSKFSINFNFNK